MLHGGCKVINHFTDKLCKQLCLVPTVTHYKAAYLEVIKLKKRSRKVIKTGKLLLLTYLIRDLRSFINLIAVNDTGLEHKEDLGNGSYIAYYQNVGILTEKNKRALEVLDENEILQTRLLGRNSPLSEDSKTFLNNRANNRVLSELGREVGLMVTMELAGMGAGKLIGQIGKWAGRLFGKGKDIAKTPVGRSGNVLNVVTKNSAATINGTKFTGHALDQMQARGILSPNVVLDVVKKPSQILPGNTSGTTVFIRNNLKNVTNAAGDIITVIPQ